VIDLDIIDKLTGGRIGRPIDVPCPLCGPYKSVRGQRRRVLRIWRTDPGFATFCCARCDEHGFVHDRHAASPDPVSLAKVRAEAAEFDRKHKAVRLNKARWLWSQRQPAHRTIVETYLRDRRGITCQLPATLGFLPATEKYPPAMIAAFGMAHEIEPGVIAIANDALRGVHLTRLLPDGSDRERGEQAKIMIAHSTGWPIVLASANDMLGLAIAEGIENTLVAHEAAGLGAWAAGSASRLPPLSDRIPNYLDCVTIIADDDPDGRRFAGVLAERVRARGIEAILPGADAWRDAA
jgi:hypothetical protein